MTSLFRPVWAGPVVDAGRRAVRGLRHPAKGIWVDLFHALASAGGPPVQVLIDSSAVKGHRSASGGKGGNTSRPLGARVGALD
jgi:hypothetical protein